MSAGQTLGAVAGFFMGGPFGAAAGMAGAWQGMMVGGMVQNILDPPRGPHSEGPRLTDLTQQISTYGASVSRTYGTFPVMGNVFWIENNRLKEVATTTSQGGKGGGGGAATQTTYSYYGTFAVGLCEGPIAGVWRIWIGANLLYDAGSSDIGAIQASNEAANFFKLYLGTDTQLPDARMQATLGVANTPAYRGLAFIVFYDLPLASYGNSIAGAQVRVEVVRAGTVTHLKGERVDYPELTTSCCYAIVDDPVTESIWMAASYPYSVSRINKQTGAMVGITDPSWLVIYGIVFDPLTKSVWICGDGFISKINIFNNVVTNFPVGRYANYLVLDLANHCLWVASQGAFSTPTLHQVDIYTGVVINHVINAYAGGMTIDPATGLLWIGQSGSVSAVDTGSGAILNSYAISSLGVYTPTGISLAAGYLWITCYSLGKMYKFSLSDFTCSEFLLGAANKSVFDPATPSLWVTRNTYGVSQIDLSSGATMATFATAGYAYSIAFDASGNAVWIGSSSTTTPFISRLNAHDFGVTPVNTTLGSIVQAEMKKSSLLTSGDIDTSLLASTVRGFAVSAVGSIRSALEPLQGAFPFDLVQHGYVIKCVPRGTSSVATIDISELDARASGNAPGIQLSRLREMDTLLPVRVDIQYLDADREYNIGGQYAARLNTAAVNIRTLDLPLVFTATEAAGIAEVLLYLYWLERFDVNFSLPPAYNPLEAADVITVNDHGTLHELRLANINYTSGGWLECAAKYNKASIYTPAAQGAAGTSSGVALTSNGLTHYELLDIPLLTGSMDTPGFVVAMAGFLPGWPGGVLYRSDDAGQSWTPVQGFTRPGSVTGYAGAALAAHDGHLIDKESVLAATLISGELYSTTEGLMLAGSNHFAYGVDGRWEIIAAQNCTLQGDGSYRLTDLLRGRSGTEWASGLHQAGDKLVSLDNSTLAFVSSNLNQIGTSRTYRGITLGKTLDSDSNQSWTYQGVNLECLSPVELNGNRNPATFDWTLTWTRRTRIGGEWRDYVDASLGEATESYVIEIRDATFATLKRTLTASAPTVAYTSAQQVTDFGSNQATLFLKIAQVSASVGTGYYFQQSITR